jgi:O-antigen/teichoic acid export membrane protein
VRELRDRKSDLLDVYSLSNHNTRTMFFWVLSTRVIQLAAGFGSNLVLAWLLSPEDFGRYALLAAPLIICYAFCSFRLSSQILACPESKFFSTLFLNAIVQEGLFSAFVFVVVLKIINVFSLFSFFVLLDVVLSVVLNNLKSFHERKMSYKDLARKELIGQLGSTFIVITVAYIYPHPIVLCLKGLLLSTYLIVKLLPRFPFQWLSLSNWIDIFKGCKAFWWDAAMETSLTYFLQLAAGFSGEKMAGLFFQAHRIASLPAQWFSTSIGRYALNLFREAENEVEKKKKLYRFLLFSFIPLLGVTLFFGIASQKIILLCFGSQWIEAAPLLTNLCGLSLLICTFHLYKQYFLSENQFKTLFWARATQFFTLVIFSLFVQNIMWLTLALSVSYLVGMSIGIYQLSTRFIVSIKSK